MKKTQQQGGNGIGVAWVTDAAGNKLFPIGMPGMFGPVQAVPADKPATPAKASKCAEGDHKTKTILETAIEDGGSRLVLKVRCRCGITGTLYFPATEAEVMCETCEWDE